MVQTHFGVSRLYQRQGLPSTRHWSWWGRGAEPHAPHSSEATSEWHRVRGQEAPAGSAGRRLPSFPRWRLTSTSSQVTPRVSLARRDNLALPN
jgi:hypothetical protein